MVRTHIGRAKDFVITERTYEQKHFKPVGLWYGIDKSWEKWCAENGLDWLSVMYQYEIHIDFTNVLVINTEKAFEDFHNKYSTMDKDGYYHTIKWEEVAKDYDGIEIAPYFYQFRMVDKYFWYYSWDCASGCIWNTKLITVGKQIELTIPIIHYD